MTCREFADFLGEYLAGDLHADVLTRFQHHLEVCPNCVRYLAQYRNSIDLGRAAFDETQSGVPESVPEDLVKAILASRTSSRS